MHICMLKYTLLLQISKKTVSNYHTLYSKFDPFCLHWSCLPCDSLNFSCAWVGGATPMQAKWIKLDLVFTHHYPRISSISAHKYISFSIVLICAGVRMVWYFLSKHAVYDNQTSGVLTAVRPVGQFLTLILHFVLRNQVFAIYLKCTVRLKIKKAAVC